MACSLRTDCCANDILAVPGQGSVEVLEAHVQAHGEAKLEDETERLNDLKLSGDATAKAAAAGGEDVGAGVGAAGAGDRNKYIDITIELPINFRTCV